MKKNVMIIGAGLVGGLLSIYLSKRGYKVAVYERRHDMRKTNLIAGKSINLALSDRGIKALREVGIMDEIMTIAVPMHGRMIHNIDGSTAFQPYGREGQFINSVSRSALNSKLISFAEKNGVAFFFDHRCETIDWETNEVTFKTSANEEKKIKAGILFGSDGAYSAARLSYLLQHDRFQYSQSYIDYGYKELHIPAGNNGSFLIEKNALHIWPRGNYMLIALPNDDGSFTCTLFFPFKGDPSFETLDSIEKVKLFFTVNFADAATLMPSLEQDFFSNPAASLVTISCFPWIQNDQFALIGDAAHAIVPFFGQGMNCGFEDCSILNDLVENYNDDWEMILPEYQQLRKPDAEAIAEMALNNFIEMRDKVGDPTFLLQKKIEAHFSKKFPDQWIPSYSQVTFSPHIRYIDALKNGKQQQTIMDEIMAIHNIEKKWDSEEIERILLQKLQTSR